MTVTPFSNLTWTIDEPGAWEIDAAHFPTPITHYFSEILEKQFPRGFKDGTARVGLLLSHFDQKVVNGFAYIAPRPVGAPKGAKGPPPKAIFKLLSWLHPELRRRLKTIAHAFETKPWRDDVKLWEETIRPESTAAHLKLQRIAPTALDDRQLGEHLQALFDNANERYYLHHRFTLSAFCPVGDFMVHAQEWTGLPTGQLLQACRQPKGVATVAGDQFQRVVEALERDAALRNELDAPNGAAEVIARLESDRGPVGAATREWLEMTAHRLVTGYDIVDLVAHEMPELLVRTLRQSLGGGRAVDARDKQRQLAASIRDAVPDQHRDAYDALLAEAISVSNLREERALVLDFWALGLVRRAVKELGKRLLVKGRVQDAAHAFDASHQEMLALLGGSGPSADALAARYAYRTTATSDIAPKNIGFKPSAPPPLTWLPKAAQRGGKAVDMCVKALFEEAEPRSEPKVVNGLNASSGVYEGTARVVLRPEDFPRIQAGDILVARMTTEAYNGIIPLLGGIVTDRGGLLSHAATVAREFGIPAVVGTQHATSRLPSGARIRIDGDLGQVRLV